MSKQGQLKEICPYSFRNCNANNQYITEEHINKIFKKLDIDEKINDIKNYQLAFVHKSYIEPTDEQLELEPPLSEEEWNPNYKNWIPLQPEAYERLEFLGDSILGAVITHYIYERYPKEEEGFMTRLKTQFVRGTNLCIVSKKLKFDRYLLLSSKYEGKGRNKDSILEDVLEAFIGGIFLDFGGGAKAFGVCQNFIIRSMERYLNMSQFARRQDNYKDLLLQYYHKYFNGANPTYTLISVYGPTNNRVFKAGVHNTDNEIITTGEGSKLVFAEQAAAKEALKYYEQQVYSDSEEPNREIFTDSDSESLDDIKL